MPPVRVAITGLGLATHLGVGVQSNWDAVTQTEWAHSGAPLRSPPDVEGFERAAHWADAAVAEAWRQADVGDIPKERLGCTFSASKPFLGESVLAPDVITQRISCTLGVLGESRNVIAACATGAYAMAWGASWIQEGLCDVVIAGSVEPQPAPLYQAGFRQMGVVSGEAVMRPFDHARSGFVFGEGAGAVVLESETHARARGRKPDLFLSGWSLGSDSHSAVAFNSGGRKIAGVIRKSIDRADLSPSDILHVNAHGTATRLNDALETQALHEAFGSHADQLKISGTKSSTGHMLGAAGSVELILTALALRHQRVPPTRHLDHADPACDLDFTPGHSVALTMDHALSISYGFGGPIGALVVSRC